MKVLFVYPSLFMQTALPLSIATLSAQLKNVGIDTTVFDTTLYRDGEEDENEIRAKVHHSTKPLDYAGAGIIPFQGTEEDAFKSVLDTYKPDMIALSVVEGNFGKGVKLARIAKGLFPSVPIVAGGVFPTLAPDIAIAEPSIDMICLGDGETVLPALCLTGDSPGLWRKSNNEVIKNPQAHPLPLDFAEYDFSIFGRHMFYKPMQGKLFKTIPLETSRGCPNSCTYCAEPELRKFHGVYRKKSVARLSRDIELSIERHSPEFFYFASETFLAMSAREFEEFVEMYGKYKLSFWIQTRPETLTPYRLRRLIDVGMYWITMGIECGNENFRRDHLKRNMSNKVITESVGMLADVGMGASLNSIIGFPFETRDLIMETIMLNRSLFKLNPSIRVNMSLFTPYRGCELHKISVEHNLVDDASFTDSTNIQPSVLHLDTISSDELMGLYRCIPLYVYLPDIYLPQVKQAETDDEVWEKLNSIVGDFLGG